MNNTDRFLAFLLFILLLVALAGVEDGIQRKLDRIEAHLAQPYRKLPDVKP